MRVSNRAADVVPLVDEIRVAADGERDALGFFPKSVYEQFAYQSRIVVALNDQTNALLGYSIFGGALPQGRILQTWTSESSRGLGVGRRLIEEVAKLLEEAYFLSMRADVAADLADANQFYERVGFEVVRTRPGGKTRGRVINVRVRELATPSLLDLAGDEHALGHLTTLPSSLGQPPLYTLDLNVLLDVSKQRVRSDIAGKVMSMAFEGDIRLAISEEMIAELLRHVAPGEADPTLAFALTLPRLPLPPTPVLSQFTADLSSLLFPSRAKNGTLRTRDHSDLRHLITAIHECATGFITSDQAVLSIATELRSRYRLDVLSPEALLPPDQVSAGEAMRASVGEAHVVVRPLEDTDYPSVERLLSNLHVAPQYVRSALSSGTVAHPRRRFVVESEGQMCGFASWPSPIGIGERQLSIFVDEGSSAASGCAEHLVGRAIADVGATGPATFNLEARVGQPSVRQAAIAGGFFADGGAARGRHLRKVALGTVVTPSNWSDVRAQLISKAGIYLPSACPEFVSEQQPILLGDAKANTRAVPLHDLERLLSPATLALTGRPAVILPITQAYAEALFKGSSQPSLLSDQEAALHAVRAYISRAGAFSAIKDGAIAVFYESGTNGGRSAVIAMARVTRRYLMEKGVASALAVRRGVLNPVAIRDIGSSTKVTVSEFDNVMLMRKPIVLSALRSMGCADGANFVTAKSITSSQLINIVEVGQPYV